MTLTLAFTPLCLNHHQPCLHLPVFHPSTTWIFFGQLRGAGSKLQCHREVWTVLLPHISALDLAMTWPICYRKTDSGDACVAHRYREENFLVMSWGIFVFSALYFFMAIKHSTGMKCRKSSLSRQWTTKLKKQDEFVVLLNFQFEVSNWKVFSLVIYRENASPSKAVH